jgi:hypothetical protein
MAKKKILKVLPRRLKEFHWPLFGSLHQQASSR